MKQRTFWRRSALLLLALALVAAACGGGDGETETGGGDDPSESDTGGGGTEESEAAAGGGEFSVYIGEPEALFPQNTNETEGAEVLNALFSALVDYDPETAEPLFGDDSERAMAQSIESDDQQNWTITLKEGFTFHNGDPVTAQSFVDAWNFGAFQPNAMGNAYFFENVEGYDDLQCTDDNPDDEDDCPVPPTVEEMSGLSAPDDTTIEVTLKAPFSQYPLTLGYTAFYPLPEVAFEDPEAFNEQPIGNGPFMMDGAWEHDAGINVVRYEEYGGKPASAEAVEFRIYAEPAAGYNDALGGDLDVLEDVPSAQIEDAMSNFGDEGLIEGESSNFTYLGFPTYDPRFEDPDVRMAFSKAIDRQTIVETIRTDAVAADAFVSPVVAGYREGACGTACEYDPEEAASLLEGAGGWEGELVLWFNQGGDHEAWMEAVSNNLRENLGIQDISFQSLDFPEYLGLLDEQGITGPFRLGWVMDYPSPQNYLEPIHGTTGSSNNTGFSNEEFDSLVEEGNAAGSVEEGIESYNQAEDVLAEEVPIAPMFFGRVIGVHSERVENVIIDAFTRLNVADITVADA